MAGSAIEKFVMRDDEYAFSYHYIPEMHPDGAGPIHRLLAEGLEYLTYMTRIWDRVIALKPESVLDVGCGDGRLLFMLAAKNSARWGWPVLAGGRLRVTSRWVQRAGGCKQPRYSRVEAHRAL